MIDADGFRPNVGIILTGPEQRVLWAKRVGQQAWQFPQGGIDYGESPRQALMRELHEEIGLEHEDVEILGVTRGWLRYRLPPQFIRHGRGRVCIGQKQKWFALRLVGSESRVRFDRGARPEFDGWRWVDWWHPLNEVVEFKRGVYARALRELAPLIGLDPVRPPPNAAASAPPSDRRMVVDNH